MALELEYGQQTSGILHWQPAKYQHIPPLARDAGTSYSSCDRLGTCTSYMCSKTYHSGLTNLPYIIHFWKPGIGTRQQQLVAYQVDICCSSPVAYCTSGELGTCSSCSEALWQHIASISGHRHQHQPRAPWTGKPLPMVSAASLLFIVLVMTDADASSKSC